MFSLWKRTLLMSNPRLGISGTRSEQFCYYFGERIISKLDYLVDLHTASFGRVNSFYVRANMTDPAMAKMARLVRPQIIVHNKGQGGDGGSCVNGNEFSLCCVVSFLRL